jgi:hypothetical protein
MIKDEKNGIGCPKIGNCRGHGEGDSRNESEMREL